MDERISFNGVLLSKCIEKLIQLKSLSQPLKSRRSRVTMIAGGATESNVSGCLPAVSSIELRGCCTLGKGFGFSYSKPIDSLSPYVFFSNEIIIVFVVLQRNGYSEPFCGI